MAAVAASRPGRGQMRSVEFRREREATWKALEETLAQAERYPLALARLGVQTGLRTVAARR